MLLSGTKDDVVNLLKLLPGGNTIVGALPKLEAYIQEQAETGAKAAIPDINNEVRSTVKPYVYTAVAVGGLGLLAGIAALVKLKSR